MRASDILAAPSSSFTRPADTNAYAAGDLAANVTSTSVTPLSWTTHPQRPGCYIAGIRLHKSTNSVTNAAFRVHLFSALPTFTSSGDNGVFATVVATAAANWIGSFDGTMVARTADGASVVLVPTEGAIIPQALAAGSTIYGLVEVLAAYTPGNAEVFTAELLMEGN